MNAASAVTAHKKSARPAPLVDHKTQKVTMPLSMSSLAELCGVSRQRVYQMLKEGVIAAVPMAGGFVVMPNEANRILGCRTQIRVRGGAIRTCFDFSRI